MFCQQTGGDMRNPEGDRNNWFGWTQADNGKWGWASPLDADGRRQLRPVRRRHPELQRRPRLATDVQRRSGASRHRPRPAPQPPRRPPPARRSSTPTATASPRAPTATTPTRSVYPGAPEVANDSIDQDCNGADAAGRLTAIVGFAANYTSRWTQFRRLRVTEAPAKANVTVTCSGKRKGCPKDKTFTTSAKGSVSLTKMFRKRLRPGAVITVAVTAPNTVGRVKKLTIRRSHTPRSQTLCLVPGARKASKC